MDASLISLCTKYLNAVHFNFLPLSLCTVVLLLHIILQYIDIVFTVIIPLVFLHVHVFLYFLEHVEH